ncbi:MULTISPECIES: type II toxin-antitoxin system VapC family toxin [Microcystis]|jgi:predicted nucleic acid-binding protein|uniref:Ribonuclease VapC26 n=6 Tax=Microcystis TaxID=1125 RepID=A0A5A5RE42_MICAE|nr:MULTISPECIES: PIN domain-containing protein [Microcystis]MCA2900698.1 PIN domain-containing protein [Microcystis sp. M035S1]MCE2663776.1 PIN domain-containing protein [Microcystis sp. 53602_E8]MCZ8362096.1 PIN domain-containing protein [Microcystis sp. LE19-251.1A]MDJ0546483.1 PIN domain-containing protein [Microcystis sp. M53601_WE4]MDJ0564782.1 PIN domain-containing protein [Microcystis sp. M49629_WE12]NCR81609.1 PIN domain-containing protein [Microcystis aeruginosa K13-10]NCR86279.1 PI
MILCDAGVLLCLVDRTQPQHKAYRNTVMRLAKPLVTTWSCLTEAMYLALHRGGWQMQKQLGQLLLDKLLVVYNIQESDFSRLLGLMEQYRDRPMDLADATLVLVAEKTGYRQILTLDADFLFYRIQNQGSFDIIQG